MMTKLTICVKSAFHSQVVNSWLPSRDHEFTRWMECSISSGGESRSWNKHAFTPDAVRCVALRWRAAPHVDACRSSCVIRVFCVLKNTHLFNVFCFSVRVSSNIDITSAHCYCIHILIVRIPLGKLSCWLSSHNRASRLWLVDIIAALTRLVHHYVHFSRNIWTWCVNN